MNMVGRRSRNFSSTIADDDGSTSTAGIVHVISCGEIRSRQSSFAISFDSSAAPQSESNLACTSHHSEFTTKGEKCKKLYPFLGTKSTWSATGSLQVEESHSLPTTTTRSGIHGSKILASPTEDDFIYSQSKGHGHPTQTTVTDPLQISSDDEDDSSTSSSKYSALYPIAEMSGTSNKTPSEHSSTEGPSLSSYVVVEQLGSTTDDSKDDSKENTPKNQISRLSLTKKLLGNSAQELKSRFRGKRKVDKRRKKSGQLNPSNR